MRVFHGLGPVGSHGDPPSPPPPPSFSWRRRLAPMVAVLVLLATSATAQEQKIEACDGMVQDLFGFSISSQGNTTAIGAATIGAFREGKVCILELDDGEWVEEQILTASDGIVFNAFGSDVVLHGDTLFVGSLAANNGAFVPVRSGAVYVFEKSGGTWSQAQKLSDDTGSANDNFGTSVAFDGTTLFVGANNHNGGGTIYVYTESGGSWTLDDELDGDAGEHFGWDVSVAGERLAIGAPHVGFFGVPIGDGAVYVFKLDSGTWTAEVTLTAGSGPANNRFGSSVDLDGNRLAVGAPEAGNQGLDEGPGSAYVYTRAGTAWTEQAQVVAGDGSDGDQLGVHVEISGDVLFAGAWGDDVFEGAVYEFGRDGNDWTESGKLVADDAVPFTGFGQRLELVGGTLFVGALEINSLGSGAVYVPDLD